MSSADQFSLEGKTAFVTGASYGLGVGFGGTSSTIGAVDYSPQMFATMEGVAGEYGTAIRPA